MHNSLLQLLERQPDNTGRGKKKRWKKNKEEEKKKVGEKHREGKHAALLTIAFWGVEIFRRKLEIKFCQDVPEYGPSPFA